MNSEQLRTILWLRWRLTRNQWRRSQGIGAAISTIIAAVAFLIGGLSFVAAFLVGTLALREASPLAILGVWSGVTVAFLVMWMVGLVAEIQRSETIDLQRLMHLPAALGQIFLINYVASHLVLSIIVVMPAMLGLAVGLTVARGPWMLLLVPLAVGVVFMITAWTYCLRGWLAAIMTNQRRRRAVIFGVTAAFVLLGQTPNIYFNVVHRHGRSERQNRTTTHSSEAQKQARKTAGGEQLTKLLAAQKFVPPLWLPLGAHALAEGRPLPALFGAMGCFGIGALGLHRAYRLTMRFYRGETDRKRAPQAKAEREAASAPVRQSAGFLELAIPKVPEQATALALTTLRSMLRAPEVKMAWASSFVITIIAIVTFGFRADSAIPAMARPFIATGAAALSLFALMQFAANQFGFDREGFRALVLSPAERRLILVGKNLAILPIGATPGGLVVLPAAIWLKLPPLTTVAAIFQLATMLLLMGMLGNLLSTLVPYRIQAGSIKPTKMPAVRMLVVFFSHALFPVVIAPVFIPPLAELLCQVGGWSRAVPVNLLLSIALAALAAWAYWRSLGPLGRLLQQREKNILDAVTAEVE